MSNNQSVTSGGSIIASQIITGNNAIAQMRDVSVNLTSGEEVNVTKELAGLREALSALGAPDAGKIERALQDAEEEAAKALPNRDEIGSALERALNYAKSASDFGERARNIATHLGPLVSWLGSNWTKILVLSGISF